MEQQSFAYKQKLFYSQKRQFGDFFSVFPIYLKVSLQLWPRFLSAFHLEFKSDFKLHAESSRNCHSLVCAQLDTIFSSVLAFRQIVFVCFYRLLKAARKTSDGFNRQFAFVQTNAEYQPFIFEQTLTRNKIFFLFLSKLFSQTRSKDVRLHDILTFIVKQ